MESIENWLSSTFALLQNKRNACLFVGFFIVISFAEHAPYFNLDVQGIHARRQAQTMWNVRNFVRHDNNILNPRIDRFNGGHDNIMRYEFPLMQWSIAQLERMFGEDIRLVRYYLFFLGIISVLALFGIIHALTKNWMLAAFTAVLFQHAPLFFYYSINPLPDNMALTASLVYVYFILMYESSRALKMLVFASLAMLIATWCKLPFLMFSIISIIFFIQRLIKNRKITSEMWVYFIVQFIVLVPAIAWYAWVMPGWINNPVLSGKVGEEVSWSEYWRILQFHLAVMFPRLILSYPLVILLLVGLFHIKHWGRQHAWIIGVLAITCFYLYYEFLPIGTVHDYYMMPFLLWLFISIAYGISYVIKWKYGNSIFMVIFLAAIIITPFTAPSKWSIWKSTKNPDFYYYARELASLVPNDEQCIILNDNSKYTFSYKIDKMGHIFDHDYLPMTFVDNIVRKYGIKYMYSDSEKINNDETFQPYIKKELGSFRTIKVYELQLPKDELKN